MPSVVRRSHFIRCSVCRRNMQRTVMRMSLCTYTQGWHRTMLFCGQCTRAVHEAIEQRMKELVL